MRYLIPLILAGCTTVSYWEHDPRMRVYDDSDIHFVRVHSSQYFDHCRKHVQHSIACAIRCASISPDHWNPACRTGYAGLPNRWRCVIASTYTRQQLAGMQDRNGMPVDQHEILHCKGYYHGF